MADTGPRWPRRSLGIAASLLGLAFIAAGGAKLDAPGRFVELFRSWGLAPYTVGWSGGIEVALGLLLFYAPTRRYGATGMVGWMAIFAPLQLRAGQTGAVLASAAVLALCLAVAIVELRSRGWGRPRPPAPLAGPPRHWTRALPFAIQLLGVSFLIRFAVGGVLYWAALPLLAVGHARVRGPGAGSDLARTVLLYLLVLGLGVSGVWGFVGHFLMSREVAASIQWAPSPFQRELAFYHLGIGVAGLLCLWIRDGFWLATGLVASVFLYGAGVVHVQEFLVHGNIAPGNWSFGILFGDAIVPTALLVLLGVDAGRRRSVGPPG